jgi:predicted Rossmann fold nucleotide-binding protein DprA/Smf involved in DNA uptake
LVCGIPELLEDLELADEAGPTAVDPTNAGRRSERQSAPGPSVAGAGRGAVLASLAPVERALAEMLAEGPATVDDLSRRTSLGAAAILGALTLLELRGLAASAGGRYVPTGSLAAWSGVRHPGQKSRE